MYNYVEKYLCTQIYIYIEIFILTNLCAYIYRLPTSSEVTVPVAELESYLCGYEDLSFLEQFLRKHKACRLALAALKCDPFNPNNPSISPLEDPSSSKEPSTTSIEPSKEHSSKENSSKEHSSKEPSPTSSQIPSIPEDDFFQAAIVTTQSNLEFPFQFTLKSGDDYLSPDYILNNGNDEIMNVLGSTTSFRGIITYLYMNIFV